MFKIILVVIVSFLIISASAAQEIDLKQSVLITLDDMRPDDIRFMPNLEVYAESQGVIVDKAFVSCPLCCPSRASLMTGLLASNHGVLHNKSPLLKSTIFEAIKEQKPEIKTGIIGKYLNSYNGDQRPEFDEWAVFKGGMIYNWFDFQLNVSGAQTQIKEYVSDYFLERANNFVDQYQLDPYLLYLHFTAPHTPAQTPEDFEFNCHGLGLLPDHFNEIDTEAPQRYQNFAEYEPKKIRKLICKRARSMAYLDSIIVPFIDKLVQRNVEVILVSDNGVMLGDFRQKEKGLPYEQVIRTPFLAFNLDIQADRLTSLVDIATNYYARFGIIPPYELDGLSYSEDRASLVVESFQKGLRRIPFVAEVSKDDISVKYRNRDKQNIKLEVPQGF